MSAKYVIYETKEDGDEHVHVIVEGLDAALEARGRYIKLVNETSVIGIQEKSVYEYLRTAKIISK